MSPEQIQQLSGLYHAALELEPHQREAFLQEACREDEALLHELKSLLAADEKVGDFLAEPATAMAAELITKEKESAMIGRLFGHYRILSHLGTGGMGEVYLAQDEKLGRKVAIKLLPVEFADSPERLRRFEREAKAASATDHPNIVTVHEIGEQDGIHYISEEFVEGETLRSLIERGPVPVFDALNIAHQIANALAAAHSAGIVHRDIKPENVMLRPDGFVKVLDFGLAGMTQPETVSGIDSKIATMPANTAPGMILGTVNYMSPEQTRGQKLDARSDLWSLGVVLYEMLTGQRPFHGESMPDIFVAILERQPMPLTESMADPPAQLEQILNKLLAKNREQRYQSSAQLAAELKRFHHRLELDAERDASRASNSATLFIRPQTATPPATQERPLSPATLPPPTDPVTKELAKVARLSRATIGLAIFLTVALIATASWWVIQQKPSAALPAALTEQLPERSFSYSLTVQKMRDGKPYQAEFQSSGRDFYENGWRFRLNFSSPQSGYLYIINEGPTVGGAIGYTMLFPLPSFKETSAKIETNELVQTGWYLFDKNPGVEKFWFVWAAQPISELEEVKAAVLNLQNKGFIDNPQKRDTVRSLLARNTAPQPITEDRTKKQTLVSNRGHILIYLAELEHH